MCVSTRSGSPRRGTAGMRPRSSKRTPDHESCHRVQHRGGERQRENTENEMQLGFKNRAAVVTGASKGIGLAIARGLAAEGCAVHLVARDSAMLEKAAVGIRADFQVSATPHALDLSCSESIATLMAATDTPDILINNAGAIPGGDLQAIDEARWR